MSVVLEIRDGDPWWNSPDIWVVPGNDPNGTPARPTAGKPTFVWARVHNKGSTNVKDAIVKYYWSNPALGVLRSTSHLIGSSYVDLNENETKEVLCIVPWIPEMVNYGHECLIAEVIHSSDQLLTPLPDAFEPYIYHQIAQKNISVIEAMDDSMIVLPFAIAAPVRRERNAVLSTSIGGHLDKTIQKQLGLDKYEVEENSKVAIGLSSNNTCEPSNENRMKISLAKGEQKIMFLKIKTSKLKSRSYVLINLISSWGEKKDGGLSYVLIRKGGENVN